MPRARKSWSAAGLKTRMNVHLAEMSAGDSSHFIAMDAQNQTDFETFVDEAIERLGQVDILVNNAGGSSGFAPIATMSNEASTSSLEGKMLVQEKRLASKDPGYYFLSYRLIALGIRHLLQEYVRSPLRMRY